METYNKNQPVIGDKAVNLMMAIDDRKMKRVRDMPTDFDTLLRIIAIQTKDIAVSKDNYKVHYVNGGSEVVISDDEQLATALEWAKSQEDKSLKLSIDTPHKYDKQARGEKRQLRAAEKLAAETGFEPQDCFAIGVPNPVEDSDDKKQQRIHERDVKKHVRKQIKDNQKVLVESIIREDRDFKPCDSNRHMCKCNGCGLENWEGIRYKCSVLKDFNFCEKCEAEKQHEHPLLKIVKPEDAPRGMFTFVNKDMPDFEKKEKRSKSKAPRLSDEEYQARKQERREKREQREPKHKDGEKKEKKEKGEIMKFRAIPVKVPASVTSMADSTAEVEITYRNDTYWPYKEGHNLEIFSDISSLDCQATKVAVPAVMGKQDYTVKLPIKVNATAKAGTHTVIIGVTNDFGVQVGQQSQFTVIVQ